MMIKLVIKEHEGTEPSQDHGSRDITRWRVQNSVNQPRLQHVGPWVLDGSAAARAVHAANHTQDISDTSDNALFT